MDNNQEKKLHYKMYKSGKQWIIAGILSATMLIAFAENINITKVTAKADQNNITYTGSYATSNSANVNNGKSASSSSSSYISGIGSLPDSANSSFASSASSSTSVSSSASTLSSSSQKDTSSSSFKDSSQSSGFQSGFSQASNSNQSSNVSDNLSQSSSASVSLSVQLASNASDDLKAHTRQIDGKTYFYDSNNNQVKSALIDDNDSYYYFGPNGYLTSFDSKFSSGSINSSEKLSIYTPDGQSVTNVDGFLTANSWYRPKQIQVSDTQWRDSTNADFRPLLSVWWPNKTVEINYLNYMSKNGLVSGQFDDNSNADDINNAVAAVRLSIENKIKADNGSLDEIKTLFTNFVNSQSEWNISSEGYNSSDGYQGGSIVYGNNNQTVNANSKYRLLNRTPTTQDGKIDYTASDFSGYEFLLGNDVDNSNPTVQAETLNWLYYLMNFGSITQNDRNGNFDSVRVDAVDNMDADILNIISQYFRDAYKINANDVNSNNHLSILEDWSGNDPYYQKDHGTNQMTIDSGYLNSLRSIFMNNPSNRSDISGIINAGVVNRQDDNTTNDAIPNYEIVRAHDAGVQEIIAQIISDKIDSNSPVFNSSWDKIQAALKIYDADENSTNKEYTQYNIPASYALTLTNKDTTPRVYYGDMYTDDGQFMAQKTPYYDSIAEMLKSRIKYVAGGQHMEAVKVNNGADTILTSVRYGKGALNAGDLGDSLTRTSGIAVVESNNPSLSLSATDKVVIHMGAAHKNQEYRQLLTATDSGIDTFYSDSSNGYVVARTDGNGDLTLDGSVIKGYANPQVSGYLSMWVPLGASDNQDVRTSPSSAPTTDGQSIHSNEASDSNVIFEAFSNFQDFAQTTDQYENVVIQKNAEEFKNLGFTYMELPPQYRSTTDGSFMDSTVQNGYAFNDRYDLGFNSPTKYGTAEQLTDAIKSLHSQGIKVIADFVPDQLYSLPNQQVVNASRANAEGNVEITSPFVNVLYDTLSKGSGTDYQAKYGGEFLEKLQELYPDLFTTKQISTGQTIDASKKLKVWTAEYLNGSNIQGRGTGYVLSSIPNYNYFTATGDGNTNINSSNLPNELLGNNVEYGLKFIDGKSKYVSTSGDIAKNAFIQDDNGNWYYVDNEGDFATSPQVINGNKYYFLSNGINLRDFVSVNSDGTMNYYQSNGIMASASSYYYSIGINKMFHVNDRGILDTGIVNINGCTQYFDQNGYQIKGEIVSFGDKDLYFDTGTGNLVTNRFISFQNGWYYAGYDGVLLKGLQRVGSQNLYFQDDGRQVKGEIVSINGHKMYFDEYSGDLHKNSFMILDGNVYYADANGYLVTGYQNINGANLYFNSDGIQIKNQFVNVDGNEFYFNGTDGSKVVNNFVFNDGNIYYLNSDGIKVTGLQKINNQSLYFDNNGVQEKGKFVNVNGNNLYLDGQSGSVVTNGFIINDENVYYVGDDGKPLKGVQHINNHQVLFDDNGVQEKDKFALNDDGTLSYYDAQDGYLAATDLKFGKSVLHINSNGQIDMPRYFVTINGNTYHFDENNKVTKGFAVISDNKYYFDDNGIMEKDKDVTVNGVDYHAGNDGILIGISNTTNSSGDNGSQLSAADNNNQSSSRVQSGASDGNEQSSSSAESSAASNNEQSSSSAQSSATSNNEQSSSSAESSASSNNERSSSSVQSSATSNDVQISSSTQSSVASSNKQTSTHNSAESSNEKGNIGSNDVENEIDKQQKTQSQAELSVNKTLSNRDFTDGNKQVTKNPSASKVSTQTTQQVTSEKTLSRMQTRENQKIERKMLTNKSLKQVNKLAANQDKIVKKELKALKKLKAELKKNDSQKLRKQYNALLQKYKDNKKYYLSLVAEKNTVKKYLKNAKSLKKDQKSLKSLDKKLYKYKKELKRHSTKKLKQAYDKGIKNEKKLNKTIKKYKGSEAKLKKAIVSSYKKTASMKNKKK